MPDMLVRLYDLPDLAPLLAAQRARGVEIRRALAPEKGVVTGWVAEHFDSLWASECDVAFARQPVACFIALVQGQLAGFACHDATCRNFFGPMGVEPGQQGRRIGEALLLSALHAMAGQGYAYAIIGGVGPADFYRKVVGAVEIEGSEPGIYRGMLGLE